MLTGYHRILGRVLLLIILVIVYGSLYPWHFVHVHLHASPLWILAHSWHPPPFRYYLRDSIINVVLYMPLGFAAHLVFRKSGLFGFGYYGPVLLGLLLSTSMEMTQLLEPARETSLIDVIMNVAGSVCGMMLGVLFEAMASRKPPRTYHLRVADHGALILAFCWFAWLFFPFFPVISLYYPYNKLAVFAQARVVETVSLISAAAGWFASGLLLTAAGIRLPRGWIFLTLLAVPAQFFVLARQPLPSFVLGAIAGVLLFAVCDWLGVSRMTEAWAFLAVIVVRGVAPFHTAAASTAFNWIPFGASLGAEWQPAASMLIEKVFYYGTAIWLMRTTGVPLVRAVVLVAAVLASIEIVQIHLPGRTPEITDPILAILMGFVLAKVSPETEKRFQSTG